MVSQGSPPFLPISIPNELVLPEVNEHLTTNSNSDLKNKKNKGDPTKILFESFEETLDRIQGATYLSTSPRQSKNSPPIIPISYTSSQSPFSIPIPINEIQKQTNITTASTPTTNTTTTNTIKKPQLLKLPKSIPTTSNNKIKSIIIDPPNPNNNGSILAKDILLQDNFIPIITETHTGSDIESFEQEAFPTGLDEKFDNLNEEEISYQSPNIIQIKQDVKIKNLVKSFSEMLPKPNSEPLPYGGIPKPEQKNKKDSVRQNSIPVPLIGHHKRKYVPITPMCSVPGASIIKYCGRVQLFYIKEALGREAELGMFCQRFLEEVQSMARATVTARGGNALIHFEITHFVLDQERAKEAYALVGLSGDAVLCK